MKQTILVTGADGFIGSHLTEALVRAGYQTKAFVLYNSFNSWGWLEQCADDVRGQFEVFAGGVNHNGDLDRAKRLIEAAAEAGADLVKFQTFNAARLVTQSAPKADYQSRTTDQAQSQFVMLRQLELTAEMHQLDRNLPGPDHKASLEPDEFAAMVRAIRNIEQALGDGIKRPSPSEAKNKPIARKSLVAARSIRAGERFTPENVTAKRPGSGISPMRWDEIIGREARRDYTVDELIEF